MSITGKYKDFAKDAPVQTRTYRGPDRRSSDQDPNDVKLTRKVRFDARGNPVMDVEAEVGAPRRREKDRTVDMIKCLTSEIPDLEISED